MTASAFRKIEAGLQDALTIARNKPAFYSLLDTFNRPPTICKGRYDRLCRVEIEEKAKDLNSIHGKERYQPLAIFPDGSYEVVQTWERSFSHFECGPNNEAVPVYINDEKSLADESNK